VTGVFLQVRIDSNRLPAKALLEMAGEPLLSFAMRALKRVNADIRALLTDAASAETLAPVADRHRFQVYVGDPEDVLRRYAAAARDFGVDTVVRATGDNPVVSGYLADEILREHLSVGADLSGYDDLPLGTGVEVLSADALQRTEAEARDPYEREHMTQYIYRHSDEFRVHRIPAPEMYRYPAGRVTVDTPEDYHFVRELVEAVYNGSPIEINDVVSWLAGYAGAGMAPDAEIRRMA
jgi:spore coat polysaccharide biosynthesis protein SpsF